MKATMPFTSYNEEFRRLEKLCRLSNLSDIDRLHYERELKYYRDTYNQIAYAEEKGLEKGLEKRFRERKAEAQSRRKI